LKLNPNYANTHDGLGFYYKATGRHEEAVRECEESRRLDPLSPFPEVSLGWAYYFARDYERAARQGRKALEIEPRFAFAYWIVGLARAQAGRADEAVEALAQAVESSGGGTTFRAHLGHAYALAGREGDARRVLAELEELARTKYVSSYYPAIIRLGLGERAAALDLLGRACDERSGSLAFLRVEPIFDSLRDEPRFRELDGRVFKQG
jgi:tetratricopeptide (TPR) repeat protein